jgi:hypothetical protein
MYGKLSISGLTIAGANTQQPGISLLTVMGIIGTIIGIVAGSQQLFSAIRRRKFRRAEDKLLEAIEADVRIDDAKAEVERYDSLKASLRDEVETQIPKQARNAYLKDRLDQLTEDLDRTYHDYQDVRRELSQAGPITDLDRGIRDAIEASTIPGRKFRESRNFYMLALLIALIFFNGAPFHVSSYFHILSYSDESTGSSIVVTMISGAICLALLALVCFSFLPNNTTVSTANIGCMGTALLMSLSVIIFIVFLWLGFLPRSSAVYQDQFNDPYDKQGIGSDRLEAFLLFNTAVIILAISLAIFIFTRQKRIIRKQRAGQSASSTHTEATRTHRNSEDRSSQQEAPDAN